MDSQLTQSLGDTANSVEQAAEASNSTAGATGGATAGAAATQSAAGAVNQQSPAMNAAKTLSAGLQSVSNQDMNSFNTIFQLSAQHPATTQMGAVQQKSLGPMPVINQPQSPTQIVTGAPITSDRMAKTKITSASQKTQSFLNALSEMYNGR